MIYIDEQINALKQSGMNDPRPQSAATPMSYMVGSVDRRTVDQMYGEQVRQGSSPYYDPKQRASLGSAQGFAQNTLQPRHFPQGPQNVVPLGGSTLKQEMKEFSPLRTAPTRPIAAYSSNGAQSPPGGFSGY